MVRETPEKVDEIIFEMNSKGKSNRIGLKISIKD